MSSRKLARLAIFCAAFCEATARAWAQAVADYAVQVSAVVQTNPPRLLLTWPADPGATNYSIYRKARDETAWGSSTPLSWNATNYVDTNVTTGGAYEYRLSKAGANYSGYGYIYAGIGAPLAEFRGKVVLLVDNTFTISLTNELARLQLDLVGDGWIVLRHDVARMVVDPANTNSNVWGARSNELLSVKALIISDYRSDTNNLKAVFLFGHIPVPYSGALAPDEHGDHSGAWPADDYYGDTDGTWRDSTLNYSVASDPRNWNVPGDGKLDSSSLPSSVELEVGRVDFANLPAFPQGERELLRQYLNKDHNFRNGSTTAERRGLIDDQFGLSTGEPLAVNGWRNFAPFFAATNTIAADWLTTLSTQSYLWGYGCGGGTYTSASGVASTSDFVTSDPRVIFTMFFGSYFGDWDSKNNFLRAALGTPGYTLTTVWAGRPNWLFHHMGLGETIGFSARLSQNNDGITYSAGSFARYVHMALLGDPTLRMHIVAPPSRLLAVTNHSGGCVLNWTASPDSVLGYYMYRAPTAAGPFTRLTTNLVAGTSYTDPAVSTNVYMVRAVKLEFSGSGTYYNASQGIFQSLDGSAGAASVVVLQPTNSTLCIAPTNITLQASLLDPANGVTNVTFYANGRKLAAATGLSYSAVWSNAPSGDYLLTARAASSSGFSTMSAPIAIRVGSTAPGLSLAKAGAGKFILSGAGIPGYSYTIQSVALLGTNSWQNIGVANADASGAFRFTNSAGITRQFFRTSYP